MKVKGIEIPEHVIATALERMRAEPFTARAIFEAVKHGFNTLKSLEDYSPKSLALRRDEVEELYNRTADRLIQAKRKAGAIELGKGRVWTWVGSCGPDDGAQGDDQ
jgi:hypothetical protein